MSSHTNEESIEALQLELNKLQGDFLDCLTNQEFSKMSSINERIEQLEAQIMKFDNHAMGAAFAVEAEHPEDTSDAANLTKAQLLIKELESSFAPSDETATIKEEAETAAPDALENVLTGSAPVIDNKSVITEAKEAKEPAPEAPAQTEAMTAPAPATQTSLADRLGLKDQPIVQKAKVRESMFKAAQRAKERQESQGESAKVVEEKLEEALVFKQVVEEATSFLDLFFNPKKFIDKQIEKQGKPAAPLAASMGKPLSDASKQESFEASPTDPVSTAARELRAKLESFCFYEILSIGQTASSAEISEAFVDKLKKLRYRFQEKKDLQQWQLDELIRTLNRAQEVLSDKAMRKKYDLSLLGMHEFVKYPGDVKAGSSSKIEENHIATSLADLLVIGQLVTGEEINTLSKSGAPTSDRQLIEYLVEKHLATFDEISAVILAQSLLSKGKLSLSQFQLAMKEMKTNSIRFVDTLVAEGWLSADDLPTGR